MTALLERAPMTYEAAMSDDTSAAKARRRLLDWATGHSVGGQVVLEPPTGSRIHDRHFAVERVQGDSAALLATAVLVSDLLVRMDLAAAGTTLGGEPEELLGVTAFLTGGLSLPVKSREWAPSDASAAAHLRWLIGHQRFFVVLQLLSSALSGVDQAAGTAQEEEAVREFTWLCRSASTCMRYAADFPPHRYGEVRDTMVPPAVNAGFSGLQTRDHQHLVSVMRALKNGGGLDRLALRSAEAVHAGVSQLYDAHVWVCDRFGGSTEPSLLMAQSRHGVGRPAVGQDPSAPDSRTRTAVPPMQAEAPIPHTQAADVAGPESGVVAARKLADQRLRQLVPDQECAR
ncbi:hypothetical protein GFH48_00335 [Streptomyces fagopyri]|uniref:Uncharacterized protein n=1 Tax=Streptomyces fagopyri TaxID=2662397 RepID=A0A5Q0L4H8_9ACTN|nr:hypothetical protein [Streptomyces fagopyri]QFZ71925.1 hypothetical protein GFH48_00335 [Streptomyces fagopyri]